MTQQNEHLRELYVEAFERLAPKRPIPEIHVSFYPYIGINHTIRVRDGSVYVRVGDICHDMPLACHRGLAYILTGKLLRKKIPQGAREVYSAFIKSTMIRERASENKKARGRKVMTTSKGKVYDLDQIFESLNSHYFAGKIPKPTLTWSAKKTYRILGHHDATHDHVAISRSLDDTDVPRYVVEYVVFHEMLHIAHPTKHVNGRRYNHTAAFKNDERKFAFFDQAELWIERNVRRLKRNVRSERRRQPL